MRLLTPSFGLRMSFISLPRWAKRALLLCNDFCIMTFALWGAWSLRINALFVPENWLILLIVLAAPVIGIATFYVRGLYRLVTRYMSQGAAAHIYVTVFIAVLIWALLILMLGVTSVPRSVILVYGLIAAPLIRLSRHGAGWVLKAMPSATPASFDQRKPVAIYGAGETGIQLLNALREGQQYRAVAFLDDDSSLHGQKIGRLKVHRPDKIARLIEREGVKEVFVAMPSASRQVRGTVIRSLKDYPVVVKTLPALADIASGRVQVSDLRPIDVEDLLGRDPVTPDPSLLTRDVLGKVVMITGAGGSIGSELSRQILRLNPRNLILFELSELSLYEIEMQLSEVLAKLRATAAAEGEPPPQTRISAVLGSVLDERLVRRTIAVHNVQTIYHAAAYKHVPLVESNPFPGITNNSLGTLAIARAAADLAVERMVLVSTDKAVRPTSIMGASKRLAELMLQSLAAEPDTQTVFTMVRFGNVLDSSGSVVRRFRRQIEAGGPVTVTHANMIRYFMSIPEAAQLVIQAGAMAEGGEVFVLDMGGPVKIDDLARTMIRLSGLEVCDAGNPDGDIVIEYVGLRPGEKLYEELLVSGNVSETSHPRIMKTSEPFLPLVELNKEIARLSGAIERYDLESVQAALQRTVEGYQPGATGVAPQPVEGDEWAPASRTLH